MASAGLRLRFEFWASAPGQRWRRGVVGTQNAATSVACSMESCHSIRSSVAQAKSSAPRKQQSGSGNSFRPSWFSTRSCWRSFVAALP